MPFEPYVSAGHLILSPRGDYVAADPLTREYHIEVFRYVLIGIYALYAWEWVVTFHEEVSRWRQVRRGEFVPVNVCLLVSRYSTAAALLASGIVFFAEKVPSCQAGLNLVYLFFQPGQISHVIVSVLRVRALSLGSPWLWRALAMLGFVTCTLWIAAIPFFKAGPVEGAMFVPYQPVCQPLPSPPFRVMGWGAAACFDIIVFAISARLIRSKVQGAFSPRAKRFMTDSVALLFLVSITANAACFFVILLYKNLILANIPIPLQFVLNSVVATRIVLHTAVWMGKGKSGLLVVPRLIDARAAGLVSVPDYDPSSRRPSAFATPQVHQSPFVDAPAEARRNASRYEETMRYFSRKEEGGGASPSSESKDIESLTVYRIGSESDNIGLGLGRSMHGIEEEHKSGASSNASNYTPSIASHPFSRPQPAPAPSTYPSGGLRIVTEVVTRRE